MNEIKQYIKHTLELYDNRQKKQSGIYDLLDAFGIEMKGSDMSYDVNYNTPKECYKNALLTSVSSNSLLYCEGLAVVKNTPLPLEHAWCLDIKSNTVIDPTWKDSSQCSYFGVVFRDKNWLLNLAQETKMYGILCNYWMLSTDQRDEIDNHLRYWYRKLNKNRKTKQL